ncbi:DUF6507 family protein [Nocardiopsis sp. NPDC050513]|uniref:DUF6507 family protein n=1 Tax=Nocardiopsis sp. NPDC050513 TaxID=3364338 RepID=UPI00379F5FBE
MSTWDITPSDVGGVLTAVAGHLGEEGGSDGLVGSMTAIEGRLTAINEKAGSVPVSVALGEFAEHHFGLLSGMASLTVSAVTGTSEATTAYVNGNLEMAAQHQAAAGEVPEPEPRNPGGPNVPL